MIILAALFCIYCKVWWHLPHIVLPFLKYGSIKALYNIYKSSFDRMPLLLPSTPMPRLILVEIYSMWFSQLSVSSIMIPKHFVNGTLFKRVLSILIPRILPSWIRFCAVTITVYSVLIILRLSLFVWAIHKYA